MYFTKLTINMYSRQCKLFRLWQFCYYSKTQSVVQQNVGRKDIQNMVDEEEFLPMASCKMGGSRMGTALNTDPKGYVVSPGFQLGWLAQK